jgi:hypothetical protein
MGVFYIEFRLSVNVERDLASKLEGISQNTEFDGR